MLALLIPALGHAGEWLEVLSNNDRTVMLYNHVEKDGDRRIVWTKTLYKTAEAGEKARRELRTDEVPAYTLAMYAYDKGWTKYKRLCRAAFDKAGNMTAKRNRIDKTTPWEYVMPDTEDEPIRANAMNACGR